MQSILTLWMILFPWTTLRGCLLRIWVAVMVGCGIYHTMGCITHRRESWGLFPTVGLHSKVHPSILKGPNLTSSFVGVITRFRKGPVVLIADITAMFHQVRVPSHDVDLLRFIWWQDGDHGQDLVVYRMVAHLFGATSSPSCASFASRKCAENNQKHFSPKAVNTVLNNFLCWWLPGIHQLWKEGSLIV